MMSEPFNLDVLNFTPLGELLGRGPSDAPKPELRAWLERDHEEIHALSLDARAPDGIDDDAYERFRERLLRHIGIEERLLFPMIERAGPGPLTVAIEELRIDHAALASLLVPTPDHVLAQEIAGLLELHHELEERSGGIYDLCMALLDDDTADAILFEAAECPPMQIAKYFDGPGTVRTAAAALEKARRAHTKFGS
jgi:hemerythrin-like domain-containing protein